MTKKIIIHTIAAIIVLGLIGFGIYEYITLNKQITSQNEELLSKDTNIEKLTNTLEGCDTIKYTSYNGYFSLVLPTNIYTKEFELSEDPNGFTIGGTYFSFDKDNPESGLLIQYSKPYIEGKGGICVDKNGEGAYTSKVIAGQDVSVCEAGGGFSAEYFKNPTRDIEYTVTTVSSNSVWPTSEQIAILKEIVLKSLEFN